MANGLAFAGLLVMLMLTVHTYSGFLYRFLSGPPAQMVAGFDQFIHANFVSLLGVTATSVGMFALSFALAYYLIHRTQRVSRPDPFRRVAISAHGGQRIQTDAPKGGDRRRPRSPGGR